jgi:hypothetical protein
MWGTSIRNWLLTAGLAFCWLGTAHGEIYKCVEGGKAVFQDTPCRGSGGAITVTPASGPAPAAPLGIANSNESSAKPDATSRLKDDVRSMEYQRRLRGIDNEIRALEGSILDYQTAMGREIAALQDRKRYAKNNLAGATWEQSISTEMQSVSDKYRVSIQVAQDRISQLRRIAADMQKNP